MKIERARAMKKSTREQKIKEILEVALRLFHSKGYSNVVMNEIAKECGMARTTLYDYFSSKNEILIKLIGDVVRNAAKTIPTGDTMLEKLTLLATDSIRQVQANRVIYKIIYQEQSNFPMEIKQEFVELSKIWTNRMTEFFKEALDHGDINPNLDIKDIIFSYQAIVNQRCAVFLLTDETINPEDEARRLMNILWYGLYKKEKEQWSN